LRVESLVLALALKV